MNATAQTTDENWAAFGFTSTEIIEQVRDLNDAGQLARALTTTGDENPDQPVIYVKLPDGSVVHGYDIEAETLTDGSVVYNIVLRAE